MENLWVLCRNCHKDSEILGVREKFRWLLRMNPRVRAENNFVKVGGWPNFRAFLEERMVQEGKLEQFQELDWDTVMRKAMDIRWPEEETEARSPAEVKQAIREGMLLHEPPPPPKPPPRPRGTPKQAWLFGLGNGKTQ